MSLKLKIANIVLSLLAAGTLLVPAYAFAESTPTPRPGFFAGIKQFAQRKGRAAIGTGIVSAKNGTTLTVTKDGQTFTVLTDDKTQFRRRFWGKSSLDEISVNDKVNVVGRWTDDAKTTIQAVLIRDLSIQKRFGVFFGNVSSLNSNGWVMSTHRGNVTVTVNGGTKFINRRGETITQGDVQVGHRVRVRGLWDMVANTLTEVSQVKDFNLPPQASPSK